MSVNVAIARVHPQRNGPCMQLFSVPCCTCVDAKCFLSFRFKSLPPHHLSIMCRFIVVAVLVASFHFLSPGPPALPDTFRLRFPVHGPSAITFHFIIFGVCVVRVDLYPSQFRLPFRRISFLGVAIAFQFGFVSNRFAIPG